MKKASEISNLLTEAKKEATLPKPLIDLGVKVIYYNTILKDKKKGPKYLEKFEAKCKDLGLDPGRTIVDIKNLKMGKK